MLKFVENEGMLWFHFHQNNSGGHFIQDENVDQHVFIEAPNRNEANEIASRIFKGRDQFCECCGPRWRFLSEWAEGTTQPEVHGGPIWEAGGTCILHCHDGQVVKFGV